MGKKVRIVVSLLVIAIIGILIIPPTSNTDETITQVIQSEIVTSDDINFDQDIIDEAFQIYSIIETDRVFTESNDSLITQFLDDQGIDSPLSAEKFGIETQVALFDSDNAVYNISDIFGVPQLSVTDDEGRLLDLGAIQVTFESISKQKETTTDVWGMVEFYLDDTKVDSKYLWASGSNSDRLTLSLLDTLSINNNIAVAPSFSAQKKQNHTFTLSDEGRNWTHDSEHTYRIVITKLHANLNSEQDHKEFHWSGQHIAYELKVKVDEKKKVVYDYMGEAIQVFKSDNTLQLCGKTTQQEISYVGWVNHQATPPPVIIKDSDGNILLDVSFNPSQVQHTKFGGKHAFGQIWSSSSCSEAFVGIPRNADLTFEIDNQSYNVHTDSSQKNYYVNADWSKSPQTSCSYQCQGAVPPNDGSLVSVTTNFGYESNSGNIVKLGDNPTPYSRSAPTFLDHPDEGLK